MARKPYITRTMNKMLVTAMMVDTDTAEVSNQDVIIGHVIKDSKALEKAVRAKVETDTMKFVSVVDCEIQTGVYGITEEDFMAHAVKLDPKDRSTVEE